MSSRIKVEPAIAKDRQKVQAIRVFPGKVLKQEIDSSIERGERPGLIVKKEFSGKREVEEVSLVFTGDYHLEPFSYYTKDPATWKTFGEIYFTPIQAIQLVPKLMRIAEAVAKDQTQTELKQFIKVRDQIMTGAQIGQLLRQLATVKAEAPGRQKRARGRPRR